MLAFLIGLVAFGIDVIITYFIVKVAVAGDMFQLSTEVSAVKTQNERLHNELKTELKELKQLLQEQNEKVDRLAKIE